MLIKRRNIVILAIIIFMCSFLNIVNVSAAVISGTYTIAEDVLNSDLYYNDFLTDNSGHTTYYDALIASGKLESFHEAVMNNGYKYYFYDNDRLRVWNSDDIIIGFSFTDDTGYSNSGYMLKSYMFNPNSETVYSYSYTDWINSNKLSVMTSTSKFIGTYLGRHKRSSSSSTTYSGFNTVSYANNGLTYYHFPGINTNKDIIYTASLPIEYGSSKNYYQSVSINGKVYNDGDIIYSNGPTLNSYSNSFDTTNIDYIKVKLDVNDIIDSEASVEFEYSLNNYVLDGIADNLPYPYIETIYLDTSEDTNIDFMQYRTDTFDSYSDSMAVDLLQDLNTTVYYNFVIDTRNYNDVLQLDFSSFLGYEVVLYYSDGTTEVQHTTGTVSSTDTYTPSTVTINLNDYEGIVLMPKVYSYSDSLAELYGGSVHYNQDYTVFLNGVYDIFVYTNPGNYVTLTDTYKSYRESYFTYNFGYIDFTDDKNTNYMKIIKVDSSDITDYTITIDTNMFTYSLIESVTDNIIVDNANIPGQTINTGTVDEAYKLYEANQSLSDVDSSLNKVTNFINDMKECMLIFSDLITFTFNNLNSYCQNFIIVTFIILVVVGIILILRR